MVKEIQTYYIVLIGFPQTAFQSIILVGGEEIISLMLSSALITAHLFLQRPKTTGKKLEAPAAYGFKD